MSGGKDSHGPVKVTDKRAASEPAEETPTSARAHGEAPAASEVPSDVARPDAAEGAMPPADFTSFVLSLNMSCLLQLGDAQLPGIERQIDLDMARHTIDLLSMLEQKTQGNLTGEEERLMSELLYDLRMRYVAKAKTSNASSRHAD